MPVRSDLEAEEHTLLPAVRSVEPTSPAGARDGHPVKRSVCGRVSSEGVKARFSGTTRVTPSLEPPRGDLAYSVEGVVALGLVRIKSQSRDHVIFSDGAPFDAKAWQERRRHENCLPCGAAGRAPADVEPDALLHRYEAKELPAHLTLTADVAIEASDKTCTRRPSEARLRRNDLPSSEPGPPLESNLAAHLHEGRRRKGRPGGDQCREHAANRIREAVDLGVGERSLRCADK